MLKYRLIMSIFCVFLLLPSILLAQQPLFIKGADVSFIPQIEDLGGVFKDGGVAEDPLTIFKNHGINYIRLKLWHTPSENYNNLEKILVMAQRVKEQELGFLLNFHYSDSWADPGKQTKPAAWRDISYDALKDSVYAYTRHVVKALADQGTLPDMIQVGNEITVGMLWDDGRVGGSYDNSSQWVKFGDLLKAAIRGVRESCDAADSVRIMVHIDRGGSNSGARWFYDNLLEEEVAFDVIGLSYYPWWHGHLSAVESNLNDLAARYGKDIIIVETAYPWTLQWDDATDNIVSGSDDLESGYPASVKGQKTFLLDLIDIIKNTPDERGIGLFYWAPEYISVEPIGSPWENMTLFDFEGNALSSMDAFLDKQIEDEPVQITVRLNTSTLMDTLRETGFAQIRGEVSGISYNTLPDGKKITWDEGSDLIFENTGGDYWETSFQMYPGDALSYKFWTGFTKTKATFQRLGWEGAIAPYDGSSANSRLFIAGGADTVLAVQYYNSTADTKDQYWRPFESSPDSVSVYFRVNMGRVTATGEFDPENGAVAVRGAADGSGGRLSRDASNVVLTREQYSVNGESFWSGACNIAKKDVSIGDTLRYQFYCETDGLKSVPYSMIWTESLIETRNDTTLCWVYFDPDGSSAVEPFHGNALESFRLLQNYPNPFNDETVIQYQLTESSMITLKIFDVQGKVIADLFHGTQPSGLYTFPWHARDQKGEAVSSGTYLIRLEADGHVETKKVVLLR